MFLRILTLAIVLMGGIAASSASPEPAATRATKADKVLVLKDARKLMLLSNGAVIDSFKIALGANPVGPKVFQGDGRTPEGTYTLTQKNVNSRFYRSIRISYPNEDNRALARRFGIPPGGDIMIHGQPNGWHRDDGTPRAAANSVRAGDWTDGCIAVSDAEMDRIWARVDPGTPIEIRP